MREEGISKSLVGSTFFRPDIQGLRAVAVLVVVCHHAGLSVPGGFVGVDVFFVISGYVITSLLIRSLHQENRIDLRSFYERRIRRLIPALTLVLVVTLAVTFLLGSPFDNQQKITAQTAIGAITLSANAVIFLKSGGYFATPPTNNPLLNTWSLSVEEQFYLIFPLVLLGLWMIGRKIGHKVSQEKFVLFGLILVGTASFLLSVTMSFGFIHLRFSDPNWFAFYSSPTRAWEFALGGITYLVFRNGTGRVASRVLFWVGLVGILASSLLISEAMVFPGWVVLFPVTATAAVLVGGTNSPFGHRLLSNRGMVVLGGSSYSWYLWHWPFIAFGVMLFPDISSITFYAAVLSLPVSLLTTRYLENPIRFSKNLGGNRSWLILGASIAIVTALSGSLLLGARSAWWNTNITSMMNQVSQDHLWLTANCNSEIPIQERRQECTWNSGATGEPIYLLGDSLAGSLGEAVLGAGEALGRPVIAGTQGACPFIGNEIYIDGTLNADCTDFVIESSRWLAQQPPTAIVLSSSLGYLGMDTLDLAFPIGTQQTNNFDAKTEKYLEGLGHTVQRFTSAGHTVHVVLPPPGFPFTIYGSDAWYPSQCNTLQALSDISGCGVTRPEVEVFAETAALYAEVSAVVEAAGGFTIDYGTEVCTRGKCSTNAGNFWLYLDGSHISVGFSEQLAPLLTKYIK